MKILINYYVDADASIRYLKRIFVLGWMENIRRKRKECDIVLPPTAAYNDKRKKWRHKTPTNGAANVIWIWMIWDVACIQLQIDWGWECCHRIDSQMSIRMNTQITLQIWVLLLLQLKLCGSNHRHSPFIYLVMFWYFNLLIYIASRVMHYFVCLSFSLLYYYALHVVLSISYSLAPLFFFFFCVVCVLPLLFAISIH